MLKKITLEKKSWISNGVGKILIPGAIIIAGILIAAGGLIYVNKEKTQDVNKGKTQVLSIQQAAEKAISYVDQSLASQGATNTATLTGATDTESNVYQISFKISEQEYDAWVSKDGKYLFPAAYDLTENLNNASNSESNTSTDESQEATCESLKKTDRPLLEAFVVSKCPYGLQMQRVLYEIVKNLPSLAENIKVEYIGAIENNKITSMHGDAEAQENLRQICIREEQADKYWDYVGCYIKKGETDNCLTSTNVNKTKLNTCMTDTTKGLEYAKADFVSQNKYNISGSPTLITNEENLNKPNKPIEFVFGGRTAEAVKTLICCEFKEELSVCSQSLTTDSAASGFSEQYSSSSGSSSGGGCE